MIGECLSSLKVPSFLQNSIQMRKSPQPFILSVITKKRVPKTPILCVFSTLLTSDMFSYFPPKYNNFWLSQSTRNQFVGNTGTWVRIPPRPPITRFLPGAKTLFFMSSLKVPSRAPCKAHGDIDRSLSSVISRQLRHYACIVLWSVITEQPLLS